MLGTFVVFAILLGFVVVILFRSFKFIPESKRLVVFRLGRFHAVHSGFAMLLPFIEQGTLVDLGQQNIELKLDKVSIPDNVPVGMTTNIGYRIVEPAQAIQNVADYKSALMTLTETQIRKCCADLTLAELLTERPKVQERIRESVNSAAKEWGIDVSDLAITFIDVPEEVQHELRRKAEAERLRRLISEN